MKTTPTPKRGLVSDAPTGRLNFGRMGPSDRLLSGSVRTSFSCLQRYQFIATLSHSWSTAISTALAVWERPAAPTPVAIRAEATPCGSTRPAEPHPEGRQRVCGKAQCRLNDCSWIVSPAVALSTCACGGCGAISCTCAKVTPEKQQTEGRADKLGVSA